MNNLIKPRKQAGVFSFDKPEESVTLSVRIPVSLSKKIENIQQAAVAIGGQFKVAEIVRASLADAYIKAQSQLERFNNI